MLLRPCAAAQEMSAALLLAAAAQACGGPRIVLFKHFHKAGGTSLFQIARRNARVYEPFANSTTQMNGNMDDVTSPGCGAAGGAFACEDCAAALRRQRVTFVATEFNTFHERLARREPLARAPPRTPARSRPKSERARAVRVAGATRRPRWRNNGFFTLRLLADSALQKMVWIFVALALVVYLLY